MAQIDAARIPRRPRRLLDCRHERTRAQLAPTLAPTLAQALHTAHDLAALYDATVLPVHVIEELTLPLVYEVESIDVDTEDVRKRATSALQDVSGSQEVRVVSGHPARRLVHIAEDEGADLIVIATHGRTGLSRVLLGSVAEAVIRRAPCPVYTVRATPNDAHDAATA